MVTLKFKVKFETDTPAVEVSHAIGDAVEDAINMIQKAPTRLLITIPVEHNGTQIGEVIVNN